MAQAERQFKLTLAAPSYAGLRSQHDRGEVSVDEPSKDNGARPPKAASNWTLYRGDALEAYDSWPAPSTIISDGAYGVGGFHGDPRTPEEILDWYRPHVRAWSKNAMPATTLWFWNTEVGWAIVHSLLTESGWDYVESIIWDKGVQHIAGNVNGDTIRQFPVVTELCAFYRRRLEFATPLGMMPARTWLRYEWRRAGLPLNKANEVCGVKNAATRKYLTQDWLWYFPPPDMMEKLVKYANEFGDRSGRPYFSRDGRAPITSQEWASLRHPWEHQHAVTNVWAHPPLNGDERFKGNHRRSAPRVYRPGKGSAVHLNQKPLSFMRRMIYASTTVDGIVWEPFGGLCTGSVAAIELRRRPFAAEIDDVFFEIARKRLTEAVRLRQRESRVG